jgi:hypothetical protein
MVMARAGSAIEGDDEIQDRPLGAAIIVVMAAIAPIDEPATAGSDRPAAAGTATEVRLRITVLSLPDRRPGVLLLPTPTAPSARCPSL